MASEARLRAQAGSRGGGAVISGPPRPLEGSPPPLPAALRTWILELPPTALCPRVFPRPPPKPPRVSLPLPPLSLGGFPRGLLELPLFYPVWLHPGGSLPPAGLRRAPRLLPADGSPAFLEVSGCLEPEKELNQVFHLFWVCWLTY